MWDDGCLGGIHGFKKIGTNWETRNPAATPNP